MRHEKQFTALTAVFLAVLTSWGMTGCLITAFELQLEHPYGPFLACGIAAALAAVFFSFRHGGTALLCLAALICGYLYHDGRAAQQFWQLLHHLTSIYDRAYGWGVLQVPEAWQDTGCADWPLGILGALSAAAVCRSVCRRKSCWFPILATVLPLCSCIVVTDTVPAERWLLPVMAGLILLILTASVRRENGAQGLRLTAAALLPVFLALVGLFLAVPQEGYVNRSEALLETIITSARNFPQILESRMNDLASGLQPNPQKQVDLASLDPRVSFTYPVMEVTTETSGTLYLRGQDYDRYDGLGWTATENRQESFPSAAGQGEEIHIQTKHRKAFQFLPYHPALGATLSGGCADNPESQQEYTLLRHQLPEDWRQTVFRNDIASTAEWQQYLALPETTRQEAVQYLTGLYREDISNTEKADIIAALVTDSARYDLDPGKMPPEEKDFALWFLEKAEAGYCVHFATAATVLLRSADIPARYVTGYLLEAKAGQTVTVTEENAHAWAEYYEPNLGVWLPLEATPATDAPAAAAPSRPAQPAPTEVPEPLPEPTEAVSEETLPQEAAPSEPETTPPEPPTEPVRQKPLPLSLLLLPLLALILAAQRSLRLTLRRRRHRTGNPNRQALQRWREAVRLSRLLKESPTEELIVLAQKAKFSQHELTQEELLLFDSFIRSCLRRLKEKPWYLWLVYQYVFAAY